MLTEKTWKTHETICSVQRPFYNLNRVKHKSFTVELVVSGHLTSSLIHDISLF